MPRYIDADLIEPSEIIIPCGDGTYEYAEVVYMDDIREITIADVVKAKHGKWKQGCCSECGYYWGKDAPIASIPNFCPHCGADMRKETEECRLHSR